MLLTGPVPLDPLTHFFHKEALEGLSWKDYWARGVRPRLEGKPRTPLSSRVATRVPREKTPTGAAARGNP